VCVAVCLFSVELVCKRVLTVTSVCVYYGDWQCSMLDAERLQFRRMRVNENLELGGNATVSCRAEGRVQPRIQWSRLDNDDRFGQLPDDVYADDGGNLHFVEVRSTHAGRYQCVASSEQGTINITVSIEVVGTSCHFHWLKLNMLIYWNDETSYS